MAADEVRALLANFQEGYARRDLALLDDFMELFIAGDELEVIGTNALEPGSGEWCLGRQAVRALIAADWQYWGDVVFDVKGANIFVKGDAGWLATTGTVTDTIPVDDRYHGYLGYVRELLKDEEKSDKSKTLDIVQLGADIVLGLPLDDTFVWPFRFTAVVVKEAGGWRFHQMQFSFATTRAPDERC
ncbi:nuclear transport factor 2 family protein [Chloroflexota bacterium]